MPESQPGNPIKPLQFHVLDGIFAPPTGTDAGFFAPNAINMAEKEHCFAKRKSQRKRTF